MLKKNFLCGFLKFLYGVHVIKPLLNLYLFSALDVNDRFSIMYMYLFVFASQNHLAAESVMSNYMCTKCV